MRPFGSKQTSAACLDASWIAGQCQADSQSPPVAWRSTDPAQMTAHRLARRLLARRHDAPAKRRREGDFLAAFRYRIMPAGLGAAGNAHLQNGVCPLAATAIMQPPLPRFMLIAASLVPGAAWPFSSTAKARAISPRRSAAPAVRCRPAGTHAAVKKWPDESRRANLATPAWVPLPGTSASVRPIPAGGQHKACCPRRVSPLAAC